MDYLNIMIELRLNYSKRNATGQALEYQMVGEWRGASRQLVGKDVLIIWNTYALLRE
jgi:hypothetical protein